MKKHLLIFFLLTSCTPIKNSSISPIQGSNGKQLGTMNISLESFRGVSKMTAVTTTGEVFHGEVVGDKTETEKSGSSYGRSESTSSRGRSRSRSSASGDSSTTKYSSKASAMLISNKGNSMKCEFKMTYPRTGLAAGGIGECKISDGRVVPVSISGN